MIPSIMMFNEAVNPFVVYSFCLRLSLSLCEFIVPLLFGILAHVVQYFMYCKDFQCSGYE